ncbi:MAG: hypothetical protein KY476_09645 [Planctomycetes bacterium]|nr:hypothetical protein [Planctomycetota bacterium]
MPETLSVRLSADERALVAKGLRYVRSEVLLTVDDPDAEHDAERERQLRAVERLLERVEALEPATAPA